MLLTADQQSVADANSFFYGALTNRDLVAMERLWFPAEWVECVHPGMGPIRGWDAVRESWGVLFAAAGSLMVAWVGCDERIANTTEGRMVSSMARATNIFVRHDNAWRMVVHHASPVPFLELPQPEGGPLVN